MERAFYMKSVAVLMSTYNGEKYIKEQIDSILAQRDVAVTLFIRDDGSKDSTITIINNYIKEFTNIKLLNDGVNLGAGKSFLTLLKYVVNTQDGFEFYAFADQDDIWLENKLSEAVKLIAKQITPTLYCSNLLIFKDGIVEGKRYNFIPSLKLETRLLYNDFSGCTFLLNTLLAERVVESSLPSNNVIYYRYHDSWVLLIALLIGKVIYDENSYIKYRIHDNNQVGLKGFHYYQHLKELFRTGKTSRKNLRMNTAISLRAALEGQLKQEDKVILDEFADYKKSLENRIRLMFDRSLTSATGENHFLFMLKVMLGTV